MSKPRPPHLRTVPPALADALDADQRRAVADAATGRARRRQLRDSRGWANGPDGLDAIPEFLREIERAHPRACDLWRSVAPGTPLADVCEMGERFGLEHADTLRAVHALRLAELATVDGAPTDPEAGVTMQAPASVPF